MRQQASGERQLPVIPIWQQRRRRPLLICYLAGWILWLGGCGSRESPAPPTTPAKSNSASPANPEDLITVWDYHQTDDLRPNTGGNWPESGGPFRNFTSSETDLRGTWSTPAPPVLWSQSIGAGCSAPVVGEDEFYLIYRQGEDELIDCRDLQTGKLRWQFSSPISSVLVPLSSEIPAAAPVLDAESLYALGTAGILYCLSRENGELLWLRDLQADYQPDLQQFPMSSSPLLMGETLIVNWGGTTPESSVIAINRKTSQTAWTALSTGRSTAAPRFVEVAGKQHLIMVSPQQGSALNPEQGSVRWQVPLDPSAASESSRQMTPLVTPRGVVIATGNGLLCLQIQNDGTVKQRWKTEQNLASPFSNLVCVNDWLLGWSTAVDQPAELICRNVNSGEILWQWPSKSGPGHLLAADKKLYLWSQQGELTILQITSQAPRVLFQSSAEILAPPTYAAPVIAQKKLLLRNTERVLAIDLQIE